MNEPTPPNNHQQPWEILDGIDDVQVWIAHVNAEIHYYLTEANLIQAPNGQGICFELALGGQLFCHTTSDGWLLVDMSDDALWAEPIIEACNGVKKYRGRIWVLPEAALITLILGLNNLIASTTIVLQHDFGMQ